MCLPTLLKKYKSFNLKDENFNSKEIIEQLSLDEKWRLVNECTDKENGYPYDYIVAGNWKHYASRYHPVEVILSLYLYNTQERNNTSTKEILKSSFTENQKQFNQLDKKTINHAHKKFERGIKKIDNNIQNWIELIPRAS